MPEPRWKTIPLALAGALAGWWIYVPAHELLHAFGCLAAGGSVERLEISPEYGAALLQRVFPFVAVGSDYAGQLVGFDTRGSDWIYSATVFGPYLLTLFAGVPGLRALGRSGRPGSASVFLLGAVVPFAYASFANLAGDFYELGSIPVSRLGARLIAGTDPARWRSDDLSRLLHGLLAGHFQVSDLAVVTLAFLLGTLFACATYWLGAAFDRFVLRRPAP